MKFEDFLMQREEGYHKRLVLEDEVARLQEVLESEHKQNIILRCALHWPFVCRSCLSPVSCQIQILLGEIAKIEEEIMYLEWKVKELKLSVHQERRLQNYFHFQSPQQQLQLKKLPQRHLLCDLEGHGVIEQLSQSPNKEIMSKHFIGSPSVEAKSLDCTKTCDSEDEAKESSQVQPFRIKDFSYGENGKNTPNRISELLIKMLISIFQKLNVPPTYFELEDGARASKLNISCMRSKNFMPKHLASSRVPISFRGTQMLGAYSISPDSNDAARDIGPYKKFIQVTKRTLDMNRFALCLPAIEKLRSLIHKLGVVELQCMSYKQRLAFWINIYNASIMQAFLQHGLPNSPGKLLELLNKAAFKVGGILLNALAIEHFILRHASDTKYGMVEEKEALLRHTYGLGYPEPNVTFALCRGSWSSPALRVYSAENVVNELERSKVEFLEASICITSKKKIVMPKLLHWHMRDFADDDESLVEWIYSQLPRSSSLKRSMMEWLSGDNRVPLSKMVEIQPYEAEFRYLLPTS